MKKFLLAAGLLCGAALIMTGCASNSGVDPVNQSDGDGYSQEWVPLNDGREVLCLWYDKDVSHGASMSCDWEGAR